MLEFNLVVSVTVSCLPIWTDPPIPTPPDTIKAPVEVDVETVEAVTANPEVDNM